MKFQLILLVFGLVALVSSEEEEWKDLYNKVFVETDPPLRRDETLQLVKELRQVYRKDDADMKSKAIDQVLERSEVSEKRCHRPLIMSRRNMLPGRAKSLVESSHILQADICRKLWETSLLPMISDMEGSDKINIRSLVESMVKANKGKDFEGHQFNMPSKSVQLGVVHYLEQKIGKPISRKTKKVDFNQAYDIYVDNLCERINNRLETGLANNYNQLLYRSESLQLNIDALEWTKYSKICEKLRGFGYSSNPANSFHEDIVKNFISKSRFKSLASSARLEARKLRYSSKIRKMF